MESKDVKFYNEMYAKYNKDVVKHLIRRTHNNIDEAQDIASDSWIKVYKYLEAFNPKKAKFITWLFTIVNNTFIDAMRKKATERKNFNPVSIVEANSSDYDIANTVLCEDYASNLVENKELNARLERAFESLEPNQRCVAELYLRQDMSYDMISEILDIPLGTVKGTLFRAREILKNAMSMRYSVA
jgi:RNA polymerase sigma-70 factor (ECF subfamily)